MFVPKTLQRPKLSACRLDSTHGYTLPTTDIEEIVHVEIAWYIGAGVLSRIGF